MSVNKAPGQVGNRGKRQKCFQLGTRAKAHQSLSPVNHCIYLLFNKPQSLLCLCFIIFKVGIKLLLPAFLTHWQCHAGTNCVQCQAEGLENGAAAPGPPCRSVNERKPIMSGSVYFYVTLWKLYNLWKMAQIFVVLHSLNLCQLPEKIWNLCYMWKTEERTVPVFPSSNLESLHYGIILSWGCEATKSILGLSTGPSSPAHRTSPHWISTGYAFLPKPSP